MNQSSLQWFKTLENLRRKGHSVIHKSVIEALYEGKTSSVRTILYRLVRKGLLKKITNNWYCIPPCNIFDIVKVVFPSAYISLEWALHYHDILDQRITVITLVWLGKTRTVKGEYTFELHKIKKQLLFGFDDNRLAEPEKALLDTIYIRGEIPRELNLELLDMNKLREYSSKYPKRIKTMLEKLLTEI